MAYKKTRKTYHSRKTKKTVKRISAWAASLLALCAVALTASEALGGPLPSWDSVYAALGLAPTVPQALAASEGAATRVHFIDVGQGDAVLLEQEGEFALIDAGPPAAREGLLSYLEQAGVQSLALVVMTHPHADHIGAMQAVLEKFPVRQVLLPDFSKAPTPSTAMVLNLLSTVAEKGIPAATARVGDVYGVGQGTLTVVSDGITTQDNYNNISVSTLFEAPGVRFLACGDAEKEQENAMLASGVSLEANLFKATHHGSYTSNTQPFLAAVRPRIVVVSCGKDNDYGHPHDTALKSFASVGAQVFRTDENGACIAYVNGGGALQIALTTQPDTASGRKAA